MAANKNLFRLDILNISRAGVEEQARNFDREEKHRWKLYSFEMNLNNASLTTGKG